MGNIWQWIINGNAGWILKWFWVVGRKIDVYWIGELETIVMKVFFHLNTYDNSIF